MKVILTKDFIPSSDGVLMSSARGGKAQRAVFGTPAWLWRRCSIATAGFEINLTIWLRTDFPEELLGNRDTFR
jgi:hypothetical protein